VPVISYPPELPVSAARGEIADAIQSAQVVVVAGETGSGKTTQLPKICLDIGRTSIAHTQPRRIAARAVAERIAQELRVDLGDEVGYQVRFTDKTSERTQVKVMTDGVLLAEIQRDPDLRRYDTVIVDEAHERSLNIDFLLSYLHRLLARRPDLKLVITSATIDPQRFAAHFGEAPVIEVSGRTYPVEVRYRPLADPDGEERDQVQGITDAVRELVREGPGDILVFLSGEREIRDAADAVRGLRLPDTEVVPLFARLSAAEQHRVFQPHPGRRVVLATNVAETSLTVPGIRYVVDVGTARISRYSNRTKVQRLPIEPISQASADQRKGRCGRVAEGVCIRLYSEEDFASRPEFTDPEILRTNLASVILQMATLGLGEVDAFPFIDPPDQRSVRDAVQLLHELQAIDRPTGPPRVTPLGRTMTRLPVDPRLARMVIEGHRNGCLREVVVIVSALSIQDPRERPADRQDAADEQHRRFADDRSDLLSWLALWEYLRAQQRALSSNQFRKQCRTEFLHYLRVREWQDLTAQVRRAAKDAGMRVTDTPAEPEAVHRSLLAGLLSQIGLRQGGSREYLGGRGTRFVIWPGSGLARTPPEWVMAAELVETSRLWARTVAGMQPEWAEQLAAHLVKRSYGEPRWSARRGSAVADERVTLYGVPIVGARTVPYGRIDPVASRALFIRHALVEGRWRTHHRFAKANRALLDELANLEERSRRRDIVIGDDELYDFYDRRLPEQVVSARHFDRWWKTARHADPDLLTLTPADVLTETSAAPDPHACPDTWRQGDVQLRLEYRFAPGSDTDGVNVVIPLAALPQVVSDGFDWQVPGLRGELVTALLRSLPKHARTALVPIPDLVREILPDLVPGAQPLTAALAQQLRARRGVVVGPDDWDWSRVPAHLRPVFRVVDEGRVIASDRDLTQLQRRLAPTARAAVVEAAARARPQTAPALERTGLRAWPDTGVPRRIDTVHEEHPVVGFPALVDEGDSVGVRVLLTGEEQRRAMWLGTRRLLLLTTPVPARAVHDQLDNATRLSLTRNPHGSVPALLDDCRSCAVDDLMARYGAPVWDAAAFDDLRRAVATQLEGTVLDVVGRVARVLSAAGEVHQRLDRATDDPSILDVRGQVAALVYPGFVTVTGRSRLRDLPRYLTGVQRRLDKLGADPERDRRLMARVQVVVEEYQALRALPAEAVDLRAVHQIRWMIEELRISLFAQQLGTAHPVSDTRIFRAIAAARRA